MTNPTYEIIETPFGGTTINVMYDTGIMLSIPSDPANSDYQAYLVYVANGNQVSTPLASQENN